MLKLFVVYLYEAIVVIGVKLFKFGKFLVLKVKDWIWFVFFCFSYNLNHLTEWLRDQNLQDSGAADCLLPLTQAVQLFLCKKDESSISNVCTKLTIVQVKRIFYLTMNKSIQ